MELWPVHVVGDLDGLVRLAINVRPGLEGFDPFLLGEGLERDVVDWRRLLHELREFLGDRDTGDDVWLLLGE